MLVTGPNTGDSSTCNSQVGGTAQAQLWNRIATAHNNSMDDAAGHPDALCTMLTDAVKHCLLQMLARATRVTPAPQALVAGHCLSGLWPFCVSCRKEGPYTVSASL